MKTKNPNRETRRVLIAEVTATQLFPIPEQTEDEKPHAADDVPEEIEKDKE